MLLHGLVASGIYWGATYDRLALDQQLVVPDLLGFGRSPRPDKGYTPDDHVAALVTCLDDLGVQEPAVLGTHSLGTLIALRLAATHPNRVASIVAFGPPLYRTTVAATAHVAATSPMARLFALPNDTAETACQWVCRHRSVSACVAQLTHPGLPAPIAADAVQHTWVSYWQTLTRVLLAAEATSWLNDVRCPVQLVAGDRDPVVDHTFLRQVAAEHSNVTVESWPGNHNLPLSHSDDCADFIHHAVASSTAIRT